jgi:hypothetical protein
MMRLVGALRVPPPVSCNSPPLARVPIVHVASNLVFGVAISFLNLAFQLIAAATDHIKIIVGEFSPLFLHLSFQLFPVSFNPVPVHAGPPLVDLALFRAEAQSGVPAGPHISEVATSPFSVLMLTNAKMRTCVPLELGHKRPPRRRDASGTAMLRVGDVIVRTRPALSSRDRSAAEDRYVMIFELRSGTALQVNRLVEDRNLGTAEA